MEDSEIIEVLQKRLKFTNKAIKKLTYFHDYLLRWNNKYNLISKNTENHVWLRHILDSAQLVKFIKDVKLGSISDLGSGAGFPGIILAIFYADKPFHVKLVEKSPVKRIFLQQIASKLALNIQIIENAYSDSASADIIVCRAFKKLKEIVKISREIYAKPHKIIILKGKDAQAEINALSLQKNYSYSLKSSMTEPKSKIIIFQVKK
ncbi:16S rRNA (guanine(527)-N(7))-methyltransferase RsmG [Candidatus Pelagibacter bacterium]|nr:16S rRNA (guanine(527)-N(7))-methyltransferase RsmG [Candidatus Pelagibacter bacterium]